jgi:hypothetical protein
MSRSEFFRSPEGENWKNQMRAKYHIIDKPREIREMLIEDIKNKKPDTIFEIYRLNKEADGRITLSPSEIIKPSIDAHQSNPYIWDKINDNKLVDFNDGYTPDGIILLKKKSFSQNWGFNNSARRNSYSKSSTRGGRKIRKTRKVRRHRKSKKSRTCKKK